MGRHALPYRMEKRGKYWYFKRASDRHFLTTGKRSRTVAVEWVETYRMGGGRYQGNVTLRSFAAPYFRENCPWWHRENLRREGKPILARTRTHYFGDLHNHILPKFGDLSLEALYPPDISDWLYRLDYSSHTKMYIYRALMIILGDAYRDRLIYFDPRQHFKPPVVTNKEKATPPVELIFKLFPLTISGMEALWGKSTTIGIMLSTMYACGIRGGEAKALTIEAINWDIGGCKIIAAYDVEGNLSTPKAKSFRVVLVPGCTMELLKHVRADRDNGLLFCSASGKPYKPSPPRMALNRVLSRIDISKEDNKITPHSLRHAYNTRMREILRDAGHEGLWDNDSMMAQLGRHTDNVLRAFVGHKTVAMTAHYDHPDLDRTLKFYNEHFRAHAERIWEDKKNL